MKDGKIDLSEYGKLASSIEYVVSNNQVEQMTYINKDIDCEYFKGVFQISCQLTSNLPIRGCTYLNDIICTTKEGKNYTVIFGSNKILTLDKYIDMAHGKISGIDYHKLDAKIYNYSGSKEKDQDTFKCNLGKISDIDIIIDIDKKDEVAKEGSTYVVFDKDSKTIKDSYTILGNSLLSYDNLNGVSQVDVIRDDNTHIAVSSSNSGTPSVVLSEKIENLLILSNSVTISTPKSNDYVESKDVYILYDKFGLPMDDASKYVLHEISYALRNNVEYVDSYRSLHQTYMDKFDISKTYGNKYYQIDQISFGAPYTIYTNMIYKISNENKLKNIINELKNSNSHDLYIPDINIYGILEEEPLDSEEI